MESTIEEVLTIEDIVAQIMKRIVHLHNNNRITFFVDMSGHVDWLKVQCHYGGWYSGSEAHHVMTVYTNREFESREVAVAFLLDRFKDLDKAIEENNKVVAEIEKEENEKAEYERLKAKYDPELLTKAEYVEETVNAE